MAIKRTNRNFAPTAATVIVVGISPEEMGWVREVLGAQAQLPSAPTSYQDAISQLERSRPDVVLMGFDLDFDAAVRLGPQIQTETPGVQLVALSSRPDADRIRAAMRAGYREFVVVHEDTEMLRRAVREAAYSSGTTEDRGQIVALCGSKGGSGVTMLTVNLAAELSPLNRVLALDLCFSMGDVAAYLDLQPANSIVDVIENIQRLDERLLGGSVAVHHSKVHVLAQPHEPSEEENWSGELVLRVLHACALAYQYVLVDCGSTTNESILTTLTVADLILLVCTPDVPSVRNAYRRLKLLEKVGVERDHIRLVVNRATQSASISQKDIESNLGLDVAVSISADPKTCFSAMNDGRLLSNVNKRSPAVRDIGRMVGLITEGVQKVAPIGGQGFGWSLFGG